MIIMPTLQCKPGMKLGRSVYSEQRQVLARRGFVLSEGIIRRFHEMGFPFLHVEEPGTEDIMPEQAIRDETLIVLHSAIALVMEEASAPGRESLSFETVRFCNNAAAMLASDLRSRKDPVCLPVHLTTMMQDGGRRHFAEHALNVAVCATRIAIEAGLPGEELIALAAGAMLHDIGRLRSSGGQGGPAALGEDDGAHAEAGYLLLRDSGFPLLAAHCALFHHERMDGSGYPFGVGGARIHEMVQWVGIVDAFDTLVHGRIGGRPMLPHEAIEVLYAGAGTLYDFDKIKRLRDRFALFPIGAVVRLNTGEIGVVSRLHEDNKQRPVVRIVRHADGSRVAKPFELDLQQQLHLMIGSLDGGKAPDPSPACGGADLKTANVEQEPEKPTAGARREPVTVGSQWRGYWGKDWFQFV